MVLLSDFNLEGLARQLAHTTLPGIATTTRSSPVMPALAAGSPGAEWMAVVWAQPEAISGTFGRARGFEAVDHDRVIEEVTTYARAVALFAEGTRLTFVPTFTLPPWHRGYGPLDFRPGIGIAYLLARMNIALAEALQSSSRVVILDAGRWLNALGSRAWSEKLWHATKSPFTPSLYEQAAADIGAAYSGLAGRARKLIILDLDDVLWGGVVGEAGVDAIRLGGHDHVGESFAAFQRELKGLSRRGIQLAIVSKNDERVAMDAIEQHPEMVLRRADFVGWRINWNDKAENVASLLAEVGLGADAAVFIDDSASERARVASALPAVLVPDWPADPSSYREALNDLRCFDNVAITAEDRARASMYGDERSRQSARSTAQTAAEWLESLELQVTVEPLSPVNLERAAQLFNKTNQMNLATRRMSSDELRAWASDTSHQLMTFRVSDRFGDSGLTGIVGLSFDGRRAHLVDFVVSCRVLGRGVEESMLHVAVDAARRRAAEEIHAQLIPTARNTPCLDFFHRAGWRSVGTSHFVWPVSAAFPAPAWATIAERSADAAAP
jgi:FkbH-like protein